MKILQVIAVTVWCIGAAVCGMAGAEEVDLEKIVVTPSQIAQNYDDVTRKVDVVSSGQIENAAIKDTTEVLSGLTSTYTSDYGGLGASKEIRMRGSTSAQTLVLVDGRPVNSPRDGAIDLSTIPLDDIARIEVMHGSGSSVYGSQAMGGVINIITKEPPQKGEKTELYSSFGTFRTYQERISQGARFAGFGYLVNAGYQNSQGFRDNSQYDAKDFNTKFEYRINDNNNVKLSSGFFRSYLGNPSRVDSFDIDNKQRNIKDFIDGAWDFTPDEKTQFEVRGYNNYDRLEFMPNRLDSVDEAFLIDPKKDIHATTVRGYDLLFNRQVFEHYRLIFGFDHVTNLNDSTRALKHHYIVRAWSLENQFDLLEDLKATLGVRVDDYSNFGIQPSPSFSLLYRFLKKNKVRFSISKSFRAPTFNELFWPDDGMSMGNPNLRPEKGITGEIGVESELNKFVTTELTYYRSDYNQLINWVEFAPWRYTTVNVNSAVFQGIELENRIFLTKNWEGTIGYTYLSARDDKLHRYLPHQPINKGDVSLIYKDGKGLMVECVAQYTDRRFTNQDNSDYVKRFYVLGMKASKKVNQYLTCFASIDNLFNYTYEVLKGYPMPGFSITGGAKLEF